MPIGLIPIGLVTEFGVLPEFLGAMGWADVRKNQCRSPTTDPLSNVFCRFDPKFTDAG